MVMIMIDYGNNKNQSVNTENIINIKMFRSNYKNISTSLFIYIKNKNDCDYDYCQYYYCNYYNYNYNYNYSF